MCNTEVLQSCCIAHTTNLQVSISIQVFMRQPEGLLQPVHGQMYNKRFILGLERGPSDCGAQKVPGLCSHAMPLGGHTQHLLVSVPAKRQQLASTCWYLLLATSQATWTAVHEAHSHLDARAGCGRGQWSVGARPC